VEKLDSLVTNVHIPIRRIVMMRKFRIIKNIIRVRKKTKRNTINKRIISTPKRTTTLLKKGKMKIQSFYLWEWKLKIML
jgi:hypothetical protein